MNGFARRLGRHVLLSSHPRAMAPRAVGRLQVREDLIARRWLWAVQGLVTLAVVAFVGRSIARNWSEFRSLHVTLAIAPGGSRVGRPGVPDLRDADRVLAPHPVGLGSATRVRPAARTWSVANLGRYVPGRCGAWPAWWSSPSGGRQVFTNL